MRAAVLHAIGDLRVEEVPDPALAPGEETCLVRVSYAGVCSSDIGRVFRDGTYSFPLIPGHEFAGVVEACGPSCPVGLGQAVAVYPLLPCFRCPSCQRKQYPQCENYNYFGSRCDGGFAEYVKAPYFNLVPVPAGLSLREAALCEPASVALHGLRLAAVKAGDRLLIFGAGAIGVLLAQWAFLLGATEVTLADISARKLEAGRAVCPRATFLNSSATPLEELLGARRFSLCVEGAGAAACYSAAIRYAENNGRVLLVGNPASDVGLERSLVSQILRKQLTIQGTWNSNIAEPENEWARTLATAASGKLALAGLITHCYPLEEIGAALEMMRAGKEFFSRVLIAC